MFLKAVIKKYVVCLVLCLLLPGLKLQWAEWSRSEPACCSSCGKPSSREVEDIWEGKHRAAGVKIVPGTQMMLILPAHFSPEPIRVESGTYLY